MDKKTLNRLKLVLAEKDKTGVWLMSLPMPSSMISEVRIRLQGGVI